MYKTAEEELKAELDETTRVYVEMGRRRVRRQYGTTHEYSRR
jgi:hypothetical protein